MSHFAEISGSTVIRVIVAEQDFIDSGAVGTGSNWVQTSYNTFGGVHYGFDATGSYVADGGTQLRKNYAGIGYTYDEDRDAFIPRKPYNSWVLNEDTCNWEPTIAMPGLTQEQIDNKKFYTWNEENQSWTLQPI